MDFSVKGKGWVVLMFIVALLGPWFGVFVYTWHSVSSLSIQNSNLIFMGCTITIVLMVVKTIGYFNVNQKKAFIFAVAATTIALFSFLLALFELISL